MTTTTDEAGLLLLLLPSARVSTVPRTMSEIVRLMSKRLATPRESVLGSDADREWVHTQPAEHTLSGTKHATCTCHMHMHMHICMHVRTCTHMHMHICARTHMHICMCVCMCMCGRGPGLRPPYRHAYEFDPCGLGGNLRCRSHPSSKGFVYFVPRASSGSSSSACHIHALYSRSPIFTLSSLVLHGEEKKPTMCVGVRGAVACGARAARSLCPLKSRWVIQEYAGLGNIHS